MTKSTDLAAIEAEARAQLANGGAAAILAQMVLNAVESLRVAQGLPDTAKGKERAIATAWGNLDRLMRKAKGKTR